MHICNKNKFSQQMTSKANHFYSEHLLLLTLLFPLDSSWYLSGKCAFITHAFDCKMMQITKISNRISQGAAANQMNLFIYLLFDVICKLCAKLFFIYVWLDCDFHVDQNSYSYAVQSVTPYSNHMTFACSIQYSNIPLYFVHMGATLVEKKFWFYNWVIQFTWI